jgi:acyl transferase domain-containing protein
MSPDEDIAIVGMAVNVPGAQSVEAYWANLRDGVESIRRLSEAELLEAGESPDRVRRRNYVPAAAVLEGFDTFDADFFGFSPKDAAILDPQHRKFLEVAWEAMEQAGHPPETIPGPVGVYAGCGMGSYFYFNICSNPDLVDDVGMFLLRHTGNDKDFLSTRVSHVFDLRGPSINLQTACSTSLVAIHYACQALRAGEVDMALAGGVTIELPQGRGYEFKENEILSPDGHCHAFDHRAQGTVFGSGAGCVALRRLSDAVADGDHIWAVIKGSAVNNDGAAKAGYLAPSVDGQTAAIVQALDNAGVAAQSVSYVECHGTGTYLGDPIEVAALTEAYRQSTDAVDFCRIGSVKTNIGHLDTAAGVAGFVKTALALHHRQMPPSLGYEAPNPAIGFQGSPFAVNDTLRDWPAGATPRRAGINALGVGGTNAHTLLEEAPERAPSEEADWPFQVLCLSARSKAALDASSAALATHLRAHPEQPLADVAHTLKNGRRGFEKRRVLVAESHEEAARLLESGDPIRVFTHDRLGDTPEVVFMFPGGGAQYAGMARDLYETEPVFAEWMDRGLDHLQPQLDYDLRSIWLPDADGLGAANARLKKPSVQLPLIMIVEYALAQLWLSWGVKPAAMVGHSMGENVAACIAGVMRFETCIDLVLLRGRLFDEVPAGGMLSISASLHVVRELLGDDLDIASVNGPELIAVSGPQAALDAMQARLKDRKIECQRIAIDIAAHSRMLEPILDRYRAFLRKLDLQIPQLPFLSNRTGEMITDAQATDPDYWVGQLRNTVHFADCIATLAAPRDRVYLEVGPGKALSGLAQMNTNVAPAQVLSSLRHPDQQIADDMYFLGLIGRLWACGVEADWEQIWGEARRNRVVLPTYAFQRARYFIEPGKANAAKAPSLARADDIADWGFVPEWRAQLADCPADLDAALTGAPQNWLIFADKSGVADPVIDRLQAAGHHVAQVMAADAFADLGEGHFSVAAEQGRVGFDQLIAALTEAGHFPDRIAHFWLVPADPDVRAASNTFDRNIEQGFWTLTWLAQAIAAAGVDAPLHLSVFTSGAAQVADEPLTSPEKALVTGPLGVFGRELPGVTAALIDIELPQTTAPAKGWFAKPAAPAKDILTGRLLEDLLSAPRDLTAAYRGSKRFEMGYRPQSLPRIDAPAFKRGGTYLITGGFGGIGMTIAADLLAEHDANVILLSRDSLPERDRWDDYIAEQPAGDRVARRIRAVIRLEGLGGRVSVAAGNVANLAQMRRVIDGIEAEHKRLDGVIHAAGTLNDGPLLGKTNAQIDAVLSPKVQGLRVLDQLLPDGAVDLMVLFSSTSTATRAAGQVDYVAANAFLNSFAKARRGAKTRVVAVNWGVWADVGMAAEATGGGAVDVLPERALDAALLDTAGADPSGDPVFSATLSDTDWVLDHHRMVDGTAVLPGTGYIEMFAEAARAQGLRDGFELSDLYFLRALALDDTARRETRVALRRDGEGFAAELRSSCRIGARDGWQVHAQAQLMRCINKDPQYIEIEQIKSRCSVIETTRKGGRLQSPQEAHLRFGPQWHVIRETALGNSEGFARLALAEALRIQDGPRQVLHAGLMDLATGWAIGLVPGYGAQHLWVPVSYGSVRVHGDLPDEVWSWARLSEGVNRDGEARFDVTICDHTGQVLVEVRDFAMQRLTQGFSVAAPDPRDVIFDDVSANRSLTAAEERLAGIVAQGIRAKEGPEAMKRALGTGLGQIYVTALPLPALIAQASTPFESSPAVGQSYERPDLDGSFVAPRTPIEETLAGLWQNLLGVSPVGVEDSFFDLGGHSLIAVRLFAAIKRAFRVDFPISILFEAPTIAKCAALIAAEVGESAADKADDATATPVRRFTHIVPLNENTTPEATPLFLVAGMFGNVLNLRGLAVHFSDQRPVYGLQARGLIGDAAPHETVPEMARDYIAELRAVQPEGPYLIGGYSGGGVTAYEMAQQLSDAGQEVAVLAMLDTPLPVRPSLSRKDKALIKFADFRRKGPGFALEWARNRWEWEKERRRAPLEDGTRAPGSEFNNLKIEAAFLGAVSQYAAPAWHGAATLFRPPVDRHWQVSDGRWVSSEREYVFDDNDWRQHAPNLQVIEVPGDHLSMVLAPNVTTLAQELDEAIADALDKVARNDWKPAEAAE